jgi:uncharacterized membrane protein
VRRVIETQWQNVSRGFWFYPGVVALAFVGLAAGLVALDRGFGTDGIAIVFDGDASAARSILSTTAGSLITVAGLAFSITVVTSQLVSSQFTPRAIRSFLGDRISQLLAGAFVGIFAYCLLVLRSLRDENESSTGFVPSLAVSVGILLGLVGLVLLLAFIHRITQLIKVENIAARIACEALASIESLYPEPYGEPAPEDRELVARWEQESEPTVIRPERPGYVQSIALDKLQDVLGGPACVHVVARPGDYVTETSPLARVWPAEEADDGPAKRLRRLFSVQSERDVADDAGFGVRQLADIALRAISPGVNDPTTAVTCIGYLQAIVERLAGRGFPTGARRLADSGTVIVTAGPSFDAFVREAFTEIGRYASSNARVAASLLDALAAVGRAARTAGAHERLGSILETAEEIAEPALDDARTAHDRALIEERLASVRSVPSRGRAPARPA